MTEQDLIGKTARIVGIDTSPHPNDFHRRRPDGVRGGAARRRFEDRRGAAAVIEKATDVCAATTIAKGFTVVCELSPGHDGPHRGWWAPIPLPPHHQPQESHEWEDGDA